ncbi:hypothetical protein LINPERHAP2_LOCUS3261 [Linum perenne]
MGASGDLPRREGQQRPPRCRFQRSARRLRAGPILRPRIRLANDEHRRND